MVQSCAISAILLPEVAFQRHPTPAESCPEIRSCLRGDLPELGPEAPVGHLPLPFVRVELERVATAAGQIDQCVLHVPAVNGREAPV